MKALLTDENLALKTRIHAKGVVDMKLGVGVAFLLVMKLSFKVEGVGTKHVAGEREREKDELWGGRRKGAAGGNRTE